MFTRHNTMFKFLRSANEYKYEKPFHNLNENGN